jgi:hypothetical protein
MRHLNLWLAEADLLRGILRNISQDSSRCHAVRLRMFTIAVLRCS